MWVLAVVCALIVGVPIWAVVHELRKEARLRRERARVLSAGLVAEARVLRVGPSRRGRAFTTVALVVQPHDGRTPFATTVVAYLPEHAKGAVVPGQLVRVRYEPGGQVEIDLASMGYEVEG